MIGCLLKRRRLSSSARSTGERRSSRAGIIFPSVPTKEDFQQDLEDDEGPRRRIERHHLRRELVRSERRSGERREPKEIWEILGDLHPCVVVDTSWGREKKRGATRLPPPVCLWNSSECRSPCFERISLSLPRRRLLRSTPFSSSRCPFSVESLVLRKELRKGMINY